MYTGFVTNNFGNDPKPTISNKLYAKVVKKGEAFIFPRVLLHFQLNKGKVLASSLNVLNSQNPGIQLMPSALFGSGLDREMLEKSFFMNATQFAALENIFEE
ncbi:protein MpCupin47 [Marchantia polymorpha subsp. ruderalis]